MEGKENQGIFHSSFSEPSKVYSAWKYFVLGTEITQYLGLGFSKPLKKIIAKGVQIMKDQIHPVQFSVSGLL